jgi:hypothetical protein
MARVQQIYARLFTHIDVATSLLLKQDLVDAEPDGRRIQLRIKPPKAPRDNTATDTSNALHEPQGVGSGPDTTRSLAYG